MSTFVIFNFSDLGCLKQSRTFPTLKPFKEPLTDSNESIPSTSKPILVRASPISFGLSLVLINSLSQLYEISIINFNINIRL